MKKKITLLATLVTAIAAAQGTTTPAHLTAAESLVNTFRAQGQKGIFTDANGVALNRYGASWSSAFINWGPPARANAQCSSFLTLLLQVSYPGWTAKNAGFSSASPTAAAYHNAIEANACGFQKISNFATIKPGDVLAAEYYDDTANTGHVMLVRGAQALGTNASGVTTWQVDVIDCSKSTHTQDSRVFNFLYLTYTTQGVGRGYMRVLTKNGAITGYSWSMSNGSTIYAPSVRHLTLGRMK